MLGGRWLLLPGFYIFVPLLVAGKVQDLVKHILSYTLVQVVWFKLNSKLIRMIIVQWARHNHIACIVHIVAILQRQADLFFKFAEEPDFQRFLRLDDSSRQYPHTRKNLEVVWSFGHQQVFVFVHYVAAHRHLYRCLHRTTHKSPPLPLTKNP